jgi:hypothetical protein
VDEEKKFEASREDVEQVGRTNSMSRCLRTRTAGSRTAMLPPPRPQSIEQ